MKIGSTYSIQNNLTSSKKALSKTLERLSSGKRINSGSDDPAGLALANSLRAKAKGLEVENRNISYEQNNLRISSGKVGQSIEQLQNLREIALQASNGTLNDSDRANLQKQFASGVEGLEDLGNTDVAGQSVASQTSAQDSLEAIDSAIAAATSRQSEIGAQENALEYRENANAVARENLEAARSQAEDLDYAEATSDLARQQFVQKAQVAVLQAQLKQQAAVSNQFFGPLKKA